MPLYDRNQHNIVKPIILQFIRKKGESANRTDKESPTIDLHIHGQLIFFFQL